MRTIALATAALSLAASIAAFTASDARACGGCFHGEPPPGRTESPSVVTDHRMVVALAPNLTTLWDQIEYAGDPEEFAWVLPVRGSVVVGLGSDDFINALDNATAPEIRAPRRRCARPSTDGCGGSSSAGCGSGSAEADFDFDAGPQEDSGVYVTGRSVVGPYAVVQVHGDDEGAIVGWLRKHKYMVPKDLEPMLGTYVDEKFDFVAVRLRPGRGVHAMRPIRVSWRGSDPRLPLRMVKAGVGSKVGLKLFVIGDGRWKTKNFPTFAIDPKSLTWDFSAQRSDYTVLRDKQAAAFDYRAFALEASIDVSRASLPFIVPDKPVELDAGATTDAAVDAAETSTDAPSSDAPSSDAPPSDTLPLLDAGSVDVDLDGGDDDADPSSDAAEGDASTTTPDAVADSKPPPEYDAGKPPGVDPYASDLEIAYGTYSIRRVTRLRAELPAKFLDQDLELEADENQQPLPRTIEVLKANAAPVCPGNASVAGDETSSPLRATVGIALAAVAAVLARRASRR